MDGYEGTAPVPARPALQGLAGCACGAHGVSVSSEEEEKKKCWTPRKEEVLSPLCPLTQLSAFLMKGPKNRRARGLQFPGLRAAGAAVLMTFA